MLTRNLYNFLVISLIVAQASSFVMPHNHQITKISSVPLQAKKSKKNKGGKGFGKEAPVTEKRADFDSSFSAEPSMAIETSPMDDGSSFLKSVDGGSSAIPTIDESTPVEERTAAILRDQYQLRTREEQQEEFKRAEAIKEQRKKIDDWKKKADQGEDFDLMSALPAPVLIGIDTFLKAGVAICTILFVLAGIGITVEAWSKASESPLPEDIDNFIVNVIEPNFTPGLGVLLGFSISLGAFAAAQLGSSSATYREDN